MLERFWWQLRPNDLLRCSLFPQAHCTTLSCINMSICKVTLGTLGRKASQLYVYFARVAGLVFRAFSRKYKNLTQQQLYKGRGRGADEAQCHNPGVSSRQEYHPAVLLLNILYQSQELLMKYMLSILWVWMPRKGSQLLKLSLKLKRASIHS